ncbi:MAG: ABC transporter ATP-binding protein [Nitrospina sp.]|nr:ABC transporter ATP-binding protein [Nitrospina sp.]
MISPSLTSLFLLTRDKRRALFWLYLLVLGSAVVESIGIASFYPLVDMFQDESQLEYYRNKSIILIPALESLSQEQFLFYSLLGVGALFVFKNAFLVLAEYGNIRVLTRLYCAWMNRISKVYLGKPYVFFTENKAGDLVQRKIMQTQKASSALRMFVLILGSLTTIIGVFLVLCFMNLKVTLSITFLMIPVYYLTMKLSQGRMYKTGDRIVELEKQGFGLTAEVLSGIKQVKVFCAEDHFQRELRKIWDEYAGHIIRNHFISTLPRPVLETLVVLIGVGVLLMFMQVSGFGKETFPTLAVFAVGTYRILPLAAGTSSRVMLLASLLPSAETIANLLREELDRKKGCSISPMTSRFELQNVFFSYSGSDSDMVLRDLSLKFETNKFYGVVGVSGGGKSTIIDLMTGFYKPQKGRILIDGVDMSKIDISTWLCQLGLISQESFIFSGTIEDNICFGVDAVDRDQNRIKEATRIAYADEFIDLLPQNYQTVVGERGAKLSGGQRQRLAIARAIYLDPPVLIFDEATSSLDAHSERKVQAAIERLHGKRTVIVVAHRLVTVASADCIFVIEDGHLAEKGTHEELRESNGLYSSLCARQSLD